MMKKRRRCGLPCDFKLIQSVMRLAKPDFWKAMAMQNMANTKKMVGVAK